MRISALLPLVFSFAALPALQAQTGGVMIEIFEFGTNAKIGTAGGGYVEDYPGQHFSFDLRQQQTSNYWYDGEVYATASWEGWVATTWATDMVPIHHPNIQVFQGTLTRYKDYLKRPVLGLVPSAGSLTEGGSVTVTVTLKDAAGANVSIKNAIVLNLATNQSSRLSIPPSVTILANTSSASFTATATDNSAADGSVTASITGTRGTWGTCSTSVVVNSNE